MSRRPIPIEDMVRRFKIRHKTSHLFKIDKFSLLAKYGIQSVESSIFDLGGHKWKLYMYPNGNDDSARGHVSILFENQTPIDVTLQYQIFVVNQLEKKGHPHNVICDFGESSKPTKRGYTKLVSLSDLETKGYLIEDCCMFGVKLIRFEPHTKGTAECFTLIEKPPIHKVTWTNFSSLKPYEAHASDNFVVGTRKWCLNLYPYGTWTNWMQNEYGLRPQIKFSIYLLPREFINNEPKTKTFAIYKIRVLDQVNQNHIEKTGRDWLVAEVGYRTTGFYDFMPLEKLRHPYLVNNKLVVEVEFEVVSVTKYC